MRIFLLCFFYLYCQCCQAASKTWAGGAAGSWANAANWSPAGVPVVATSPATGDDIIFDGNLAAAVTITDYPAQLNTDYWGQLSLINGVSVNLSSGSDTYMYFGTGITVDAGCRLNIGAATTTVFDFGNKSSVANSGLIYGIVELKGTGTNATTNRKYYTTSGRTRLFGKLIVSGTAAQLSPSVNWTNMYIESGGELQWAREGLSLSSLTCLDGGIINITGVVSAPLDLNTSGTYLGLIIWNCPSQTGQRIPIVPSVGLIFNVDSVRVINTGTGSACLGISPCYAVGHLEVQGGTVYLGSPTVAGSVYCTSNTRINTDIKVTGGTLIGNATFTGDTGNAYPFTLAVNRNFIVTGGSVNLTNRPTGLTPGGSMQLNVAGNVSQTGGSIFSTSSFGLQNVINLSGSGAQTLQLSNMADVNLTITNTSTTLGASLAADVSITPSAAFTLAQGFVKLGNYTLTVPSSRFFQNVFTPMPKLVTNGYGKLKLTGITASSSTVFPVAAFAVNSYDPLTIAPNASATTNDYSVRVERGTTPGGIFSTRVLNRTWTINSATVITANTVGLTYQYNDSAKKATCITTAGMEEGHFAGTVWNVDPSATLINPTGTDPYTVGPFFPNALDSSFALGNLASILASQDYIRLSAQKNSNTAVLTWNAGGNLRVARYEIERSANAVLFMPLAMADAGTFTFTDDQLLAGLNYYRIKMIDIDGHRYYSNISTVLHTSKGATELSVSPNPVTGQEVYLQVVSATAGNVQIRIVDVQGRLIKNQNSTINNGLTTVTIPVPGLAAGTYYVYGITATEQTAITRFVKK